METSLERIYAGSATASGEIENQVRQMLGVADES
jgi:hypothetical protein